MLLPLMPIQSARTAKYPLASTWRAGGVLVEEQAPGVWLIRTATVVPDNERWIQAPEAAADLQRALAWARDNPPSDVDVRSVLTKLNKQA